MRQTKISFLFLFGIFVFNFTSSRAFAHGEDKPGPHGGQMRMPGALHTEVLLEGDSAVKVYLLDISFENPMVNNSSVDVSVERKKSKSGLSCSPKEDYFACTAKNPKILLGGSLIVEATRNGAKGVPAKYPLPLRFTQAKSRENNIHHYN